MANNSKEFENYFIHLKQISFLGRIYKRYFSSPILLRCTRQFGTRVMELGSGIGCGVLGAYPEKVVGLDINSEAVDYCKDLGFNTQLINEDGTFPVADGKFDVCVLDNVLEHITDPKLTLDECYRITKKNGGLVIAVPGERGFASDSDHKIYYDEGELRQLDERWHLINLFSLPFFFKSQNMSAVLKPYCLVAIYKKVQ
jgi:SAM-dependent methyltransferase